MQLPLFDGTLLEDLADRLTPPEIAVRSPETASAYRAHTAVDTTEAEARAAFVRRYGVAPSEVRWGIGGLLLAGPIPEKGVNDGALIDNGARGE